MKMKTLVLGSAAALAAVMLFSVMGNDETKKLASSDQYKVIKVDGQIVFQKTNVDMKLGDVFMPGTPLDFKTAQSRAAVISSLKGRFVLSSSEQGQTNILPAANNVSSRAGALINLIDLQNHFSGKYLVIGEMRLQLGKEAFPMDESNFFYLTYMHNNESIRKKLSFDGDYLILNKEEIFKVDGKAIAVEEKEMTMFYRQGDESKKIGTFTPVFPELGSLKTEVEIIMAEYGDKDAATQIKEITAYLNEFYGNPQKDNLGAWLKTEFSLQ
jgi:hypothetical protein